MPSKSRVEGVFLTVVSLLCLSLPLAAQEGSSLGVGIGYVDPQDLDGSFLISAHALSGLYEKILLEAEVGYWRKAAKTEYQGTVLTEGTIRDLSFSVHAHYILLESPRLILGAGSGVHSISTEAEYFGYSSKGDATRLAAHFMGGIGIPAGERVALDLFLRYDVVKHMNELKALIRVRYGL